jgi:hypothetical protein
MEPCTALPSLAQPPHPMQAPCTLCGISPGRNAPAHSALAACYAVLAAHCTALTSWPGSSCQRSTSAMLGYQVHVVCLRVCLLSFSSLITSLCGTRSLTDMESRAIAGGLSADVS